MLKDFAKDFAERLAKDLLAVMQVWMGEGRSRGKRADSYKLIVKVKVVVAPFAAAGNREVEDENDRTFKSRRA